MRKLKFREELCWSLLVYFQFHALLLSFSALHLWSLISLTPAFQVGLPNATLLWDWKAGVREKPGYFSFLLLLWAASPAVATSSIVPTPSGSLLFSWSLLLPHILCLDETTSFLYASCSGVNELIFSKDWVVNTLGFVGSHTC